MEIYRHALCNSEIGKPSDMTDETCSSLPVHYRDTEDGRFAISFWKPTADELAGLNAGHCVTLWVRAIGRQHPVVALSTVES
jgi:hypothetical protein